MCTVQCTSTTCLKKHQLWLVFEKCAIGIREWRNNFADPHSLAITSKYTIVFSMAHDKHDETLIIFQTFILTHIRDCCPYLLQTFQTHTFLLNNTRHYKTHDI